MQQVSMVRFNKTMYHEFLLVVEVHNSYTTFGILGVRSLKIYDLIVKRKFDSSQIENITVEMNNLLGEVHNTHSIEINTVCFAVSGPVNSDRTFARATELNWGISKEEILKNTMLRKVNILNDFEAIGYGVNLLDKFDKRSIVEVKHSGKRIKPMVREPCGIIGAGSGLGMSLLIFNKRKNTYVPLPSEGGHTSLSANNEFEWGLIKYLKDNVTHGSQPDYEKVLSEKGIINIYNYLKLIHFDSGDEITKMIDKLDSSERVGEIIKHYNQSYTCEKVIEVFLDFFARAAKDLALTILPYCGLYLANNLVSSLYKEIQKQHFMRSFETHGQQGDLLRRIPLYIVKEEDVRLIGCGNATVNFFYLIN